MDALLPIQRNARQHEARVLEHEHHASYAATFRQLEMIQPHAQQAFDVLVNHVEHAAPLPPSQCIPHGGNVSATPAEIGHCSNLFVP
jgi:hypothetical protein